MRNIWLFLVFLCVMSIGITSCSSDENVSEDPFGMGILPPQTKSLIDEEFQIFCRNHPEMDESQARTEFEIIQKMSTKFSDPQVAAWAERKALARRWIKVRIEDVFAESTVSEEMLQQAVDAYAFESGHPALVTASHILIRNDKTSTPEARSAALEAVRQNLLKLPQITDEDLRREAVRLTHAGFRVDMNADLTFPKRAMVAFLGDQLNYNAVVEPFADAAFALSSDHPLSQVTPTEFGVHLILFKSRTEEQKAQLPQDRDFMLKHIVKAGRKLAAKQFIGEMMNNLSENNGFAFDQERLEQLTGLRFSE